MTKKIIGCAIEVHRDLGSGLPESAYERSTNADLYAIDKGRSWIVEHAMFERLVDGIK